MSSFLAVRIPLSLHMIASPHSVVAVTARFARPRHHSSRRTWRILSALNSSFPIHSNVATNHYLLSLTSLPHDESRMQSIVNFTPNTLPCAHFFRPPHLPPLQSGYCRLRILLLSVMRRKSLLGLISSHSLFLISRYLRWEQMFIANLCHPRRPPCFCS